MRCNFGGGGNFKNKVAYIDPHDRTLKRYMSLGVCDEIFLTTPLGGGVRRKVSLLPWGYTWGSYICLLVCDRIYLDAPAGVKKKKKKKENFRK